jgi:hypothetical protein
MSPGHAYVAGHDFFVAASYPRLVGSAELAAT